MPDRIFRRPCWAIVAIVQLAVALGTAADIVNPEDTDYPPGFVATYSVGDATVERIDADLSFVWGTAPPDHRLPAGPFQARWETLLLVRANGEFQFSAFVNGQVRITLGDDVILSGMTTESQWIDSSRVPLDVGEYPLVVEYERGDDEAELRLFWSADTFPPEPIPGHLLFREEGRPDLSRVTRGYRELARGRCQACHKIPGQAPVLAAPSLTSVGWETSPSWLVEHLIDPEVSGSMPRYRITRSQAETVLALLADHADELKPLTVKPPADADVAAGRTLLHSIGCLACHRLGDFGDSGPYAGPDLSKIGERRSATWLTTWLQNPKRLNSNHRMPEVVLSRQEREQVAAALSSLRDDADHTFGTNSKNVDFQDGRTLLRSSGCVNCHHLPKALTADRVAAPTLLGDAVNWDKACTTAAPDRPSTQPHYTNIDVPALQNYLATLNTNAAPRSSFDLGAELLERKGCLACHDRDGAKGLSTQAASIANHIPDLQGVSPTLVPPRLTGVGDKLKDEYLSTAIAGRQEKTRLPWLRVRMPRYQHSDEDRDAITAFLIGHDRIPPHELTPRIAEPERAKPDPADAATLVAAHDLLGGKGFSCIACHGIGDYEPKNVALGTRGSNLSMLGARMRGEFFLRWVRSPLRIVPGVEMPSYTRPIPGVLDTDLSTQLTALWSGLHDPRLKPPSNPGVVEQFWTVTADGGIRILRDTFQVIGSNGEQLLPHTFAAGFPNGHNWLIDLDGPAMRGWWFGDFAEQNAVGKSWYWKAAGLPVRRSDDSLPLWALVPRDATPGTGTLHLPHARVGTAARLLDYAQDKSGLTLRYRIGFLIDDELVEITVTDRYEPFAGSVSGFVRSSTAADIPANLRLVPIRPPGTAILGDARVELAEPDVAWVEYAGHVVGDWTSVPSRDTDEWSVRFQTDLPRDTLPLTTAVVEPIQPRSIRTVPGFDGVRLPLNDKVFMPTAIAFNRSGRTFITSLKGHVYRIDDTDDDGIGDALSVIEEGLAAPYGLFFDGDDLLVSHKPEILRLHGAGRGDDVYRRSVFSTGWGLTDNYHDWTCGIVRDSKGNFFVTLGSDYTQPKRPQDRRRWRGAALKIDPEGRPHPISFGLRYPTGLTITADDHLLVSDQQGVQNTFNEINLLEPGKHYGVPAMADRKDAAADPPAIQIPHPWTRSVNGLDMISSAAWPERYQAFDGQGLGAEYNRRFLIRFSLDEVDGVMQGAVYPFSTPDDGALSDNFLGPLSLACAPNGDIYVGSITDSGWSGGPNTGELVRLRPNGELPNGIREVTAVPGGFAITFIDEIPDDLRNAPDRFNITGYHRIWAGTYATPDSDRYRAEVTSITTQANRLILHIPDLRPGYTYDIHCRSESQSLWPSEAYYTLHRIPKKQTAGR